MIKTFLRFRLLIATVILATTQPAQCTTFLRSLYKTFAFASKAAALPAFASSSNYFYKKYTNNPAKEPIKSGTEQDFSSNNELYQEISEQFYQTATQCANKPGDLLRIEKSTLQLCVLLLKQRYQYWHQNPDAAPLYIKLWDQDDVPLPDTKIKSLTFSTSLPSNVLGQTAIISTPQAQKIPLINWNEYTNKIKKILNMGKLKKYKEPVLLGYTSRSFVSINSSLVHEPSVLLSVLLHEITHLEQYNNALALNAYLKKKYGITLNWLHPFYTGYTNKASNQIYESIEKDPILEALSLPCNALTQSFSSRRSKKHTLLKKLIAKRITQAMSPFTKYNAYDLEAEADRSICYFIHNPYLLNDYFSKNVSSYFSEGAIKGYDPDFQASVAYYTTEYYKKCRHLKQKHQEECNALQPLLKKEQQRQKDCNRKLIKHNRKDNFYDTISLIASTSIIAWPLKARAVSLCAKLCKKK